MATTRSTVRLAEIKLMGVTVHSSYWCNGNDILNGGNGNDIPRQVSNDNPIGGNGDDVLVWG